MSRIASRKTVRKYISRGLEPPTYGPRPHRQKSTDPFLSYLRQRLAAFPSLTAVRRGLHAVVENLARYATDRLERGNVTAQSGLQFLVNDEPRPEPTRPGLVFSTRSFAWKTASTTSALPECRLRACQERASIPRPSARRRSDSCRSLCRRKRLCSGPAQAKDGRRLLWESGGRSLKCSLSYHEDQCRPGLASY